MPATEGFSTANAMEKEMRSAQNSATEKLRASHAKWKHTVGERLLRFAGIGLAVAAIGYGLFITGNIGNQPPGNKPVETAALALNERETGRRNLDERPEFAIKYPDAPLVKDVLLVAASVEGDHQVQVETLSEAISSYFGVNVTAVTAEDALPDLIENTGSVVVFGNEYFEHDEQLQALATRVKERGLPLFWIGSGFSKISGLFDLEYKDPNEEIVTIASESVLVYKGVEIYAGGLPFVRGETGALAETTEVLATLKLHGMFSRPAIFRHGKTTYTPLIPLPGYYDSPPLALTVAIDALSYQLGRHGRDPRVIFRLEDINGDYYDANDTSFTKTAGYLLGEGVHIHLGIIPRMVNAEGKTIAELKDATPVLDLIRKHPSLISVAQHGTHHHRVDPRNKDMASGVAWEFFFNDDETMGREAAAQFARDRITEGYGLMAQLGLHPVMFEAPHYEISPSQQEVANSMFPVMLHQPLFFGEQNIQYPVMLPWITQRGDTVYAPNDVGYVDALNENSVDDILHSLDQLKRILPDPVAIVFFHPFMMEHQGREQDLARLIEGIRRLDYRFISLLDALEPVQSHENQH